MPRVYGCEADHDTDVQLARRPWGYRGQQRGKSYDAERQYDHGSIRLQEAQECTPWSSVSHCGFRPIRAAGFPRTIAIWHSYMDNVTLT